MKQRLLPNYSKVLGQLRHLLTALGPLVALHSDISLTSWNIYVGAGMTILGFVLSWTSGEKA